MMDNHPNILSNAKKERIVTSLSYRYDVSLIIHTDLIQQPAITYYMDVRRDWKNEWQTGYLFNSGQVLVNQVPPRLQFDKCVDLSGRCLYPASIVKDNHDGRFLEIKNQEEMIHRWQRMKKWLMLNFSGASVEGLVKQMEDSLADREYITQSFQKHLFYQLYFFPLYKNHTTALIVEARHAFSIIAHSPPVVFLCERMFARTGMDNGHTYIKVTGKCIDKRHYSDIAFAKIESLNTSGSGGCEGHLELDYSLNTSGMISSIKGYMEITDNDTTSTKLIVDIKADTSVHLREEHFDPLNIPEV